MNDDYTSCLLPCIVFNKSTLTSPVTMSVFKDGIKVPISKYLEPNNGLRYYSQFFEALHCAVIFKLSLQDLIGDFSTKLESIISESEDDQRNRRLTFINRQLKLICNV